MPGDRKAQPRGHGALRLQDKVIAADKTCKGSFEAHAVVGGGAENKLVADIREDDEALQLMIPVGPLALDVKRQVDLRPRCLTNGTGTGAVMRGAARSTG